MRLEREQPVSSSMQRQDAFHFLRQGIKSYTHHSPRGIDSLQFSDNVKGGLVQGDVVKNWYDAQTAVFALAGGVVVAYHHRRKYHSPSCLNKGEEFEGFLEFSVESNRWSYAEGVTKAIIQGVKRRFPEAKAI